ncbi:Ca(2+)-dependent cysteine protease [Lunasporangiospora selenospora]|uniref:Ca(2+)-dependent cysteine protease n=1 Tax=Lunasporangiospora selenospora TaxID=979761 RepID=A0A9P6FW90_9FUNG|nr:Ca(2+)-dependent cysteine protease [Lunasporangiospora selenospora]
MYPGQYSSSQYPGQQSYAPPPGNPPPAQGYPYGGNNMYPPPAGYGGYQQYPAPGYGPPPPHGQPYYSPPAPGPGGYAPPPSNNNGYAPPGAEYRQQPMYAPPNYQIPQQPMAPEHVPPPPEGWAVRQNPARAPPVDFRLSNCQGRKRALFIGINYFGQNGELRGCINDVTNIKSFVTKNFGFREEDTIALTDDQEDPSRTPTRANILSAMQWLVRDAQPNDSFFFHYSGHGGQTEDKDGDEDDGYDETIYPVDHESAGVIIDDDMHSIMVHPLPAGCRLTAIMDCCHSGSALDLPYIYSTTGNIKEPNKLADVGNGVMTAGMAYLAGDMGGVMRGLGNLGRSLLVPKNRDRAIESKSSPADCIMFSGCKDTQTSADAHEQGFGMTGAMTFSFITALTANPRQSYLELLNSIRDILRAKYEQKPQLSASHPVDLSLLFTM